MTRDNSACKIYQLGIEIEKQGKLFYAACARMTKDPSVKKLCTELSIWEEQHGILFENLLSRLHKNPASDQPNDLDNELQSFLQAAAATHVFIANSDVDVVLATANTPAKILSVALAFEKDSLVVFTAMARLVSGRSGKKSIDTIIKEELKHISIISTKLASLKT